MDRENARAEWAAPGAYRLKADITDNRLRFRRYSDDDLAAAGHPSRLHVRSRLDDARPRLTDVRVTPFPVDVRAVTKQVTVSIRATDTGSGVRGLSLRYGAPPETSFTSMRRVIGTRRDGRWQATFDLNPCAAGTWTLGFRARDGVGLRRDGYSGDAFRVLAAGDNVRPTPVVNDFIAPRAGPLTVVFSEDVTGISTTSAVVRSEGYARFHAQPTPAPPTGTWTCQATDGSGTPCATGWVRTATFTLAAPLKPNTNYRLELNPEHVLDVVDRYGNPATSTNFRTAGATR